MNRNIGMTLLGLGFIGAMTLGCGDEPATRVQGGQGPTPPTRLSARFVTATQIRLDWNDNSMSEDGFDIYEAIRVDSHFVKISTAPENARYFFLEGKSSDLTYFYKIRAISPSGMSAFSNTYKLEGGSMLARLRISEGSMRCAAFSPNGTKIATGDGGYSVRLWNWETESEDINFITHQRAPVDVSFSPGGSRLSSSDDIQTVIWDLNSGEFFTSFVGTRAQFTPDGRYLLAQIDTVAKLLDPTSFNVMHVLERAGAEFCISTDGHWLVTGGDTLRKFDLTSNADTIKSVLQITRYYSPEGDLEGIISNNKVLAISPDATHALVGSRYIRLADATVVRRMANFAGTCFAISPDGKKLVAGTNDWKILLWNVETGELLRQLSGHTMAVYSVAWSPNNSYVVSASGDGSARVWGPFFN